MPELLVAKHDGRVMVRVPLAGRRRLSIGRSPRCDLRLNASSISRRHALLFAHAGQWHIVDTGSRTGVFAGLEKVRHRILDPDSWTRIGPAYLWLDLKEKGQGVTPPTDLGSLSLAKDDAIGEMAELLLPTDAEVIGWPASSDKPSKTRLVVLDATASGLERYRLDGRELVTIGRSAECDIVLHDDKVSRLHCVLYTETNDRWCVTDAGSAGGVRVEGRATRRRRLVPERLIRVGSSVLWLEQPVSSPDDSDAEASAAGDAFVGESAFFDAPDDLQPPAEEPRPPHAATRG
jgi:pSer/pThr/pTyr-binding forkhead associated (FHA) protein